MTMPVRCAQCGTENSPDANFCVTCGARLAKPPLAAPPPGPGTAMPAAPPPTPQAPPPQTFTPPPAMATPPIAPSQAPGGAMAPEWSDEKEPMLLLDVTGSMNYGTSANDRTPRRDTIREAISIIVAALAAEDSQAAHEEEGGLRTVTFAGGQARDIGDLNPNNLQQKWSQISWAGGTRIMPGWTTLMNTYAEEFGQVDPSQRPLLMAVVITDGEADDTAQFAQALAQASGGVYAVLAILGYGPDHDAALHAYQSIEQNNSHVRVVTLASETDPQVIAQTLLRMIE